MERHFKILILLFTGLFSFNGFSQEEVEQVLKSSLTQALMKKEWRIDKILGYDEEIETYTLTSFDRTKTGKFAGNLVHFADKGIFESEYTAWCGNDNFTLLNGEYKFLPDDRVAINVKEIKYFGEWDKPEEHRETNWMIFSMKMSGDTVLLTKQENYTDFKKEGK